jgi:hypothetical protein
MRTPLQSNECEPHPHQKKKRERKEAARVGEIQKEWARSRDEVSEERRLRKRRK